MELHNEFEQYWECRNGKRSAQRELYDAYYEPMMLLCRRYVPAVYDAEEVLSDAFIHFFNALKNDFQYTGSGAMSAYLRKIVINQALMFLRKIKIVFDEINEKELRIEDHQTGMLQHYDAVDILKVIQSLPTGYRTVFNLYALEGYSHKEIAQTLDITVSTSKSQLMKARLLLQKKIKNL